MLSWAAAAKAAPASIAAPTNTSSPPITAYPSKALGYLRRPPALRVRRLKRLLIDDGRPDDLRAMVSASAAAAASAPTQMFIAAKRATPTAWRRAVTGTIRFCGHPQSSRLPPLAPSLTLSHFTLMGPRLPARPTAPPARNVRCLKDVVWSGGWQMKLRRLATASNAALASAQTQPIPAAPVQSVRRYAAASPALRAISKAEMRALAITQSCCRRRPRLHTTGEGWPPPAWSTDQHKQTVAK